MRKLFSQLLISLTIYLFSLTSFAANMPDEDLTQALMGDWTSCAPDMPPELCHFFLTESSFYPSMTSESNVTFLGDPILQFKSNWQVENSNLVHTSYEITDPDGNTTKGNTPLRYKIEFIDNTHIQLIDPELDPEDEDNVEDLYRR